MITRATPFVQSDGRLTPAAWLQMDRLFRPPGPHATNAAALAAGLPVGTIYHTLTGELRVVV
jgi:hypothetical protein